MRRGRMKNRDERQRCGRASHRAGEWALDLPYWAAAEFEYPMRQLPVEFYQSTWEVLRRTIPRFVLILTSALATSLVVSGERDSGRSRTGFRRLQPPRPRNLP